MNNHQTANVSVQLNDNKRISMDPKIEVSAKKAPTTPTTTSPLSTTEKSTPIEFTFCQNVTYHISNGLGNMFYRLGFQVASHPWNTIIVSWLLVLGCSTGLMSFHNEKDPMKLWIPQDSKFIRDTQWVMHTIEEGYRIQSVLLTAPNVLDPHVLQDLAHISEEVVKFKVKLSNGTELGLDDVCFKIPFIADYVTEPKNEKTNSTDFMEDLLGLNRPFNPSVDAPSALYCMIVNSLPRGCMTQNMLELWKFDTDRIANLSVNDVLNALATTTISPTSGHDTDFTQLLGGIQRNASGHIVAASSLLTHWMVYVNFSAVDHDKTGNLAGTEGWASVEALQWERGFLDTMERLEMNLTGNETKMFYNAERSYGDISAATMFQDMDMVFIGAALMFIYMEIVLSRFGWTEFRLILGSMGLLSVGMAFISAIGICSWLGVSYGPVHTSLPFLLMGLGVDDIFVIMSCWRQVQSMNTGCTIPERVGLMLKHAGASITVTSFTDVVAFLIGASTILPSLESYCIYAAVGVFLMYVFALTFVVAILALDERRIAAKRNSIIPCIIHETQDKGQLCCELNLMHRTLKVVYSKFILTQPGKIIVVMTALGMSCYSLEAMLRLQQKFDPKWFIPERTYLHAYHVQQKNFYPDIGFEASVFMGKINYTQELNSIVRTLDRIENGTHLVHDVNSWTAPFQEFVSVHYSKDVYTEQLTDLEWRTYLSKFLFSSSGGRYQAQFRFDTPLTCGEPTGNVTVSSVPFRYRRFGERNDYVPAMHTIERMVDEMHVTTGDRFATVWGRIYGNWITDEVIDTEVLRNILLALVCVMACTTLLIANLPTCFFIFVCVLLTLINVCGFMQRWGLTIDLVSCIGLELAVGLCVDYAAHVGHTFLTIKEGTRNERALETILHIGAAVLYGGGSTLLAVSMLANSEAYTFKAFFKIFLLVILFGLFHGVVFLPVVLSLIGPDAYITKDDGPSIKFERSLEEDEIISFIHGTRTIGEGDENNEDGVTRQATSKSPNRSSVISIQADVEEMQQLKQ